MPHILYSFRRCPYAMRGRMGLKIADIDYEHREIILRDKPASMLEFSPKGTVPVLIKDDSQVIDESIDIMLWALTQNDPQAWLKGDSESMLALIKTCETDFKPHLDRYKYASRYKDDVARGALDLTHRAEAEKFITRLEGKLTAAPYLYGDSPRLADYAIFPFIRQFANTDRTWWDAANYPKVQAWLEGFLEGAFFKSIMGKYDLWKDV